MEPLSKLIRNIVGSIALFVIGCYITYVHLPERFYEFIGKTWNIEFSIYMFDDVNNQKGRSILAFLWGFGSLYTKSFAVFRKNPFYFLMGFLAIFVGFFIGVLVNTLIYKNHHGHIVEVDVRDCLKLTALLTSVVVTQILVYYVLNYIEKRKARADQPLA